MQDRYFLDTSILIYSFDASSVAKQKIACDLMGRALERQAGIISVQVAQEFLNVATRKFKKPLSKEDASLYLDQVLMPLCEVQTSLALLQVAIDLMQEAHHSFYDSLIIAAALEGGCSVLYSEDMQTGRKLRGLKIVNPFVS